MFISFINISADISFFLSFFLALSLFLSFSFFLCIFMNHNIHIILLYSLLFDYSLYSNCLIDSLIHCFILPLLSHNIMIILIDLFLIYLTNHNFITPLHNKYLPFLFPLPEADEAVSSLPVQLAVMAHQLGKVSLLCNIFNFLLSALVCIASDVSDGSSDQGVNIIDYIHYDDMTAVLHTLESRFPELCKLHTIGQSVQGRELWVLQISDRIDETEPDEPMFKYVGNIHGNEAVSRQILIYLIEDLLENYGSDERIAKLINTTNIFIMPSANPDGFEMANMGDCVDVVGRPNAHLVDLNRNFPDQFRTKDRPEREPETLALMQWIEANPFVLSANLHGGSVVASYPFDDSANHTVQVRTGSELELVIDSWCEIFFDVINRAEVKSVFTIQFQIQFLEPFIMFMVNSNFLECWTVSTHSLQHYTFNST